MCSRLRRARRWQMTDPADGRLAPKSSPDARTTRRSALQRWVNEGGSLGPEENGSIGEQDPAKSAGKEARDTVAGCRDRAAEDRLRAAATDTDNGRRVLERSAASWESRADGIEGVENASEQQRAADRELWASEERDDPGSA